MSNITTESTETSSTIKSKKFFTKFIQYNPFDYKNYLLTLSVQKRKEFEQRVSYEKIWNNFDQDKFYNNNGSLKNNCGIYCIMNLVNRKKYFGESFYLNTRRNVHFCALNKNRHENDYLQKAFNKYGKENFIMFIVEFCEAKNLKNIECDYIESFGDLSDKFLYNLKKERDGKLVHSQQSRDKLSTSRSKYTYIIINKNDEIFTQNSLNKFCKKYKICDTDLGKTFNTKINDYRYQAGGCKVLDKFMINNKLSNQYFDEKTIRINYKNEIEIFNLYIKNGSKKYDKKYIILTPLLNIETIFNIKDYCKLNNINSTHLYSTLSKNRYHTYFYRILSKLDFDDYTEYDYSKEIAIHKEFILENNRNNIYTIEHRNGEIKILTKDDLIIFCKLNNTLYSTLYTSFNKNPDWFTVDWKITNIEKTLNFK